MLKDLMYSIFSQNIDICQLILPFFSCRTLFHICLLDKRHHLLLLNSPHILTRFHESFNELYVHWPHRNSTQLLQCCQVLFREHYCSLCTIDYNKQQQEKVSYFARKKSGNNIIPTTSIIYPLRIRLCDKCFKIVFCPIPMRIFTRRQPDEELKGDMYKSIAHHPFHTRITHKDDYISTRFIGATTVKSMTLLRRSFGSYVDLIRQLQSHNICMETSRHWRNFRTNDVLVALDLFDVWRLCTISDVCYSDLGDIMIYIYLKFHDGTKHYHEWVSTQSQRIAPFETRLVGNKNFTDSTRRQHYVGYFETYVWYEMYKMSDNRQHLYDAIDGIRSKKLTKSQCLACFCEFCRTLLEERFTGCFPSRSCIKDKQKQLKKLVLKKQQQLLRR